MGRRSFLGRREGSQRHDRPESKRGGRAANQRRASARRVLVRFPLVAEFLPREQTFTHLSNGAAGPPTKDELPLDVCWSASRWSLNSCQENKLSRTCRTGVRTMVVRTSLWLSNYCTVRISSFSSKEGRNATTAGFGEILRAGNAKLPSRRTRVDPRFLTLSSGGVVI